MTPTLAYKTFHITHHNSSVVMLRPRAALPRCGQCGRAGASLTCHTCDKTLCPNCYRGHAHPLVAGGQGRDVADLRDYAAVLWLCVLAMAAAVLWLMGVAM